jgi:hypothetical protein
MRAEDEILIRVQRDWNGWRTGEVRLGDIQNVHWFQPSRAPRPLVHGYISCASIVRGDIPHDCHRSEAPHRLLVCVLKRHTVPSAYVELMRRADEERIGSPNGCASPVDPGTLRDQRMSGGYRGRSSSPR